MCLPFIYSWAFFCLVKGCCFLKLAFNSFFNWGEKPTLAVTPEDLSEIFVLSKLTQQISAEVEIADKTP